MSKKNIIDFEYGGQLVADTLKKHNVKQVFALCGGHISPILVACNKSGIRVIDVRHEANAVFAADAVSRISGVPGVAIVTAGPGVTNTVTAIKNSQMAQSPVIIIGGATATMLKNRGSLQDIDQISLMKSLVKWSTTLKKAPPIVSVLEKAFQIAQSDIPGPVFLEIPIDILYPVKIVRDMYGVASKKSGSKSASSKMIQWYLERHSKKLFKGIESIRAPNVLPHKIPSYTINQLDKALEIVQDAERPILLVGSQAMLTPHTIDKLTTAVETLGIPTYLSSMARGLLGRYSNIQFRHGRKQALREADVVLLAGVVNDFRLDYGGHISRTATLISINRSKEDLNKNKKPQLGILSDPGEFIKGLANKIDEAETNWSKWITTLREREKERENEIKEQATTSFEAVNPIRLLIEIENQMADDSVIVADGGDFVASAAYILKPRGPLRWLDPGVFGTLGSGAGFALGVKQCRLETELWLLYGDGSVGYTLSEWDSFVRHKIPVIGIIGNDASWNQIAREQIAMFNDDVGVTLGKTAYEKVVQGFGAKGLEIKSDNEIEAVLQEAKNFNKEGYPVLINAYIAKTDFRSGSISL
jgi:thiamine pyrophosphate-dependent acetolactate synthase large subunit-like protein